MKNLQDTVASVQNAPSSIFTKDDVLNLLNGIELPKEATINPLTQFQIESLINKVIDTVRDDADNLDSDCIDRDSAEFSLNYNYCIELDSVEFDTSHIADAVTTNIDDTITEWFEKAFPVTEEEVSVDGYVEGTSEDNNN
jgi:hypothetical protein